jgi:hypothetical protein
MASGPSGKVRVDGLDFGDDPDVALSILIKFLKFHKLLKPVTKPKRQVGWPAAGPPPPARPTRYRWAA